MPVETGSHLERKEGKVFLPGAERKGNPPEYLNHGKPAPLVVRADVWYSLHHLSARLLGGPGGCALNISAYKVEEMEAARGLVGAVS